jgi:hypothetical protein
MKLINIRHKLIECTELFQKIVIFFQVICSLVSIVRHYYTLSHLYKTTLCENILTPGAIRVFHNHPTIREDDMVDLVCTLLCLLLFIL